ncbi:MAG: hypothetical protein ACP5VX_06225, partial [Thermogladius sp.]
VRRDVAEGAGRPGIDVSEPLGRRLEGIGGVLESLDIERKAGHIREGRGRVEEGSSLRPLPPTLALKERKPDLLRRNYVQWPTFHETLNYVWEEAFFTGL